jgi:hypothetical protein
MKRATGERVAALAALKQLVDIVIGKLVHGAFSSWKRARLPPPVTTALQCPN